MSICGWRTGHFSTWEAIPWKCVHTPGHTSGSICLYEFTSKTLFSGDTVFAGGALSYIAESGSIGDYINSITRLEARKISRIYPGHGKICHESRRRFSPGDPEC